MDDLFDWRRKRALDAEAPLAARMRPRTLDEYVGQAAIVGPGRLLRRAIQADQLGSLIFYGPPGTGKTTLARVIANTTKAEFIALNAVLSGVKDIREAVQRAQHLRGERGRRSILFIDEVHRFNKSQQDALLPWVENGTVILVGATTENSDGEVLIATIQFTGFTEAPPAGQYGGGDVNIFIQVQAGGEQLRPMGPDQTVTVTETGGSIRVTLDPSTVPAAGFIQCG